MGGDLSQAVVPLSSALTILAGFVATMGSIVIWVFATFEQKSDSAEKHLALAKRVDSQELTLNKVASDVSYIRGRMEPK